MQPIMNTYGRLPVTFVKGEGSWVFDTDGKKYLDALSGIAVCGLGHAHPAVSQAIREQADNLVHTSNLYGIGRQQELAERLTRISGMDNVFFSNSGAEANEAAIKIARKYGFDQGITEPQIIVMTKAFHGRTMATLTATGNPAAHVGFAPLVSGFIRVPYQDLASAEAIVAANPNVVAIMLEPIQGEGGLATASSDYIQGLRNLCDDNDLLMMLDEVQTGNGRTGTYFNFQQHSITPDVLTTAKGLGNGVPIGACIAKGKAANVLQPGNHGSTYGGNPLACAAAIAVIDSIEKENIEDNVKTRSEQMRSAFTTRLIEKGLATELRGTGLMIGIVINQDCPQLIKEALDIGLLINVTSGNVIRLLPPLNINQQDADQVVNLVCQLVENLK
ncbi:MAG TPA: aspartate aminotransferase family protein [Oceanospirillales bacterium]|nr:aspartate aminotransferase family protein [Oleispira sp.]HCM05763.1 aspartate aminotransferase family protein [Oceanospirillales bacterium]